MIIIRTPINPEPDSFIILEEGLKHMYLSCTYGDGVIIYVPKYDELLVGWRRSHDLRIIVYSIQDNITLL